MARGSVRRLSGGWGYRIDLGADPATGKRRQVSKQGFRTKGLAEAALRAVTGDIDDGTVAPRTTRTLGDFLDEWLLLQKDRLRPTTLHSYAMAIERIKRGLGHAKLQALTPLQIERFYADMMTAGGKKGGGSLAPKTVRNSHTVL
ncbi:MAG: integrase family protein, partial [Acidimicrobiales bacterium]|nr:integrase family protein [Acidimicrobiales bacterium]